MKPIAQVLATALAVLAPALARGAESEQHSAIHIEPGKDQLVLTAASPAVTLRKTVAAPGSMPGSAFLIKPKVVAEVLKSLGDKAVEVIPGDMLSVKSTTPAYLGRFPRLSAEGWTSLADASKTQATSVQLDGFALADAMRQVRAASGDSAGGAIGHVHVLFGVAKDALVTATDGHRAHRATIHIETKLEAPLEALIPRDAVEALVATLPTESQAVTLAIASDRALLRLEVADTQLWVRLGEGEFPPISDLLTGPLQRLEQAALVPRADLQAALRRTGLVVEDIHAVRLCFGARDVLEMECRSSGAVASEEVRLSRPWEGGAVDVGVNGAYLKAALDMLSGEAVRLAPGTPEDPVFLAPQDGTEAWALVMPMKIEARS